MVPIASEGQFKDVPVTVYDVVVTGVAVKVFPDVPPDHE